MFSSDLALSTSYLRRSGNASSDGVIFEWCRFSSNVFFLQWRTSRMVIRATMKNPPNEMPIMMAKLSLVSSFLVGARDNKYTGAWKLIEWTPLKSMQLNWDNWMRIIDIIEQIFMKLSVLTHQGDFPSISEEKMWQRISPDWWQTTWLFTLNERVENLNSGLARMNPVIGKGAT